MNEHKPIKTRGFLTSVVSVVGRGATASVSLILCAICLGDRINPEKAPKCSVNPKRVLATVRGNAGCLIQIDGKAITARHKPTGTWNLPGGTQEPGESAQCTAHRETWEETGLDVWVGELLRKFENGFYLFACEPKTPLPTQGIRLPEWSRTEVTEIKLLDPHTIKPEEYRFPDQLEIVRKLVR